LDPTTPRTILAAPALTPVVADAPAAQGDVLVLPWPGSTAPAARAAAVAAGEAVPAAGRTVLVGRTHCHTIHTIPEPASTWTPSRPAGLTLGVLAVPPAGMAVLGHPDHGDLHIGPGVWVLRRQRTATLTIPVPDSAPAVADDPSARPDYAAWLD
jgi:hypothetical protein